MKPWQRLGVLITLAALLSACSGSEVHEQSARRGRPAAATRTVAGPGQYTVQRGDTLYSIAFRNQLDYHDLASWNGIGRDYAIYPGRVLRLTPPGSLNLPAPSGPDESTRSDSRPQSGVVAATPSRPVPSVPPLPPNTANPPAIAHGEAPSSLSSGSIAADHSAARDNAD